MISSDEIKSQSLIRMIRSLANGISVLISKSLEIFSSLSRNRRRILGFTFQRLDLLYSEFVHLDYRVEFYPTEFRYKDRIYHWNL